MVPTFSRHRYAREQVRLPRERSFTTNKGEEDIYKSKFEKVGTHFEKLGIV